MVSIRDYKLNSMWSRDGAGGGGMERPRSPLFLRDPRHHAWPLDVDGSQPGGPRDGELTVVRGKERAAGAHARRGQMQKVQPLESTSVVTDRRVGPGQRQNRQGEPSGHQTRTGCVARDRARCSSGDLRSPGRGEPPACLAASPQSFGLARRAPPPYADSIATRASRRLPGAPCTTLCTTCRIQRNVTSNG